MPGALAQPIHVAALSAAKTSFAIAGDPRLRLHAAQDVAGSAPDVLVAPMHRPGYDFAGLIAQAPAAAWARVAAGQALLVFDSSTEGHPHNPRQTQALQDFLDSHGLPRGQAVWITQDRRYADDYRAWREAQDAPGAAMHTLNYDWFIKALVKPYETTGEAVFAARRAAFLARPPAREKRFISLNFTPRTAKVAFLLRLLKDGLWDQGFISFGGFADADSPRAIRADVQAKRLRASEHFGGMMEGLAEDFARLEAMGPVFLEGQQRRLSRGEAHKIPAFDEQLAEHDRSWFTVVTETEIEGPRRITEKSLKPLLGFHPAIVLGNAGSLALLRELGFRSFYGYFDEAYDAEPHPRRRFMQVYSEVMRLCRLDEAELTRMERDWAETLTFNAEWGLTRLPGVYRDSIDVAFVDRIARLLGRA